MKHKLTRVQLPLEPEFRLITIEDGTNLAVPVYPFTVNRPFLPYTVCMRYSKTACSIVYPCANYPLLTSFGELVSPTEWMDGYMGTEPMHCDMDDLFLPAGNYMYSFGGAFIPPQVFINHLIIVQKH